METPITEVHSKGRRRGEALAEKLERPASRNELGSEICPEDKTKWKRLQKLRVLGPGRKRAPAKTCQTEGNVADGETRSRPPI